MKNHHEFQMRALHERDAAAVAALIRLAFAAQSVATDPPPSALREQPDSVAAILAQHGGFGAWHDAALIGAVLWQAQPPALYLGRLAVHPQWRGRGVARALVAAVEDAARVMGMARLTLSTRLVLAENRRLFAACGFVERARHAHPGYAEPTFVDMEKPLA